MMNFAPTDVGVFIVETRITKRPHVFNLSDKRVEPPNNHNPMASKKLDVASSSTNKAPLKEAVSHKFLVLKVKQTPKVTEANDQMI